MRYKKLGTSNIDISEICLGTMTWGKQNNQQQADEQIDYALEQGINFFDTAEVYAIPPTPETFGTTEAIIGNWLARNQDKRENIILATKITGPGLPWIRDGEAITGASVIEAVDASLQRLQTDYIDLYQLHWTNRPHPHFGKHWPGSVDLSTIDSEKEIAGMLEILQALETCREAGKIRACGLSDDTPWGLSQYLQLAKEHDLPKMESIQNECNLLHIKDWPYMMESCALSNVSYLAWSPMTRGVLSGKYRNGNVPENSRRAIEDPQRLFRDTEATNNAVDAYYDLAQRHDIPLAELALAWVYQLESVTSTIIGATSLEQLKQNIEAYNLKLSPEILDEINSLLRQHPAPF